MCGLAPCSNDKCTWGEKYRLYCLENFKDKVKKLNEMPYKQAIEHCKKIEAQKGRIAALEIWKSSKHFRGDGDGTKKIQSRNNGQRPK